MRGFTALVGVSFKQLMLTVFGGANKKKSASSIVAFAGISAVMLLLSLTFVWMFVVELGPLGGLDIMVALMLLMAVGISLVFTIFASQSLIFGTKDIDLVFSLPVSAFSVMLSRVLALYLEILLITQLIMVPAGVAYVLYGGEGGIGFALLLFLACFFWALLPTIVGLAFGALVSLISASFKHKNAAITIISILLTGAVVVASFILPSGMEAMVTDIEGVRSAVFGIFPPTAWVVWGAGGQLVYLLLLVAVSVIPFLALVWLFSKLYKKLLTRLASHRLSSNYKLRSVGASGRFSALLKKEAGRFFGTPIYVLNCGIAIIMLVGLAVFAAVQKGTIDTYIALLAAEMPEFTELLVYLPPLAAGVIGLLLVLVYPAAVSLSLEGKYFWILKEAPLGAGRIFAAKAGFNSLLSGGTAIVSAIMLGYALSFTIAEVAAIILLCVLFSILCSLAGVYINLLLPRMDVENDSIIIKRSASAMLGMLANLLVLALLAGLFILVRGLGFLAFAGIASLLLLLLSAGLWALLKTQGVKRFNAL